MIRSHLISLCSSCELSFSKPCFTIAHWPADGSAFFTWSHLLGNIQQLSLFLVSIQTAGVQWGTYICPSSPAGAGLRYTETLWTSSIVFQPKSQHQWQTNSNYKSDAKREPQGLLLVGLSSFLLLEVRGHLNCLTAADLRENVHRSHVQERPSWEEHSHTRGGELALRRTTRLWIQK